MFTRTIKTMKVEVSTKAGTQEIIIAHQPNEKLINREIKKVVGHSNFFFEVLEVQENKYSMPLEVFLEHAELVSDDTEETV